MIRFNCWSQKILLCKGSDYFSVISVIPVILICSRAESLSKLKLPSLSIGHSIILSRALAFESMLSSQWPSLKKKKYQINLAFRSALRTVDLRSKAGCVSTIQEKYFFLAIVLNLHYLCSL